MSDHIETGGTLEVTGTISFKFQVHSAACNVFTLTELKELIEKDKIGWFIDYYLGSPMPPGEDEVDDERYDIISFDVRPSAETITAEFKIKTTEKYLVLDPDKVSLDDMCVPLDPNDTTYP